LLEARRNGLGVEDLIQTLRKVAADEEDEGLVRTPAAKSGVKRG
jgi:hypothetical protein